MRARAANCPVPADRGNSLFSNRENCPRFFSDDAMRRAARCRSRLDDDGFSFREVRVLLVAEWVNYRLADSHGRRWITMECCILWNRHFIVLRELGEVIIYANLEH